MLKKFISILLLLFTVSNLFCEEKTSYDDVKFPQWVKDLRRTEIITFGSLPFVTLWTTLGYSIAEYGEFRNPLDKSADSFTTDEQKKIIAISSGICLGLGLTDLVITIIKRHFNSKKRVLNANFVEVVPFSSITENEEILKGNYFSENRKIYEEKSYLIEGVVENAVF